MLATGRRPSRGTRQWQFPERTSASSATEGCFGHGKLKLKHTGSKEQTSILIMKFESFSFHVTQLKYVSLAMTHITAPIFRPDGKTPVQVTTMLTDADAAMAAFMDKFDELNVARGQLDGARLAAHGAAVDVYACMKSCYRNNRGELASIRRLPKEDRTAVQTLTRVKGLSRRWATLPPPFPGGTFQVGTVTLAIFDGLLADLELKISTYNDCSAQFQAQQIALRDMDEDITSFVTAALAQGRASYAEGTMNRAYINAIPVEPSTSLPVQPIINVATSPASGAVRLEFSALHATSFAVWHKGPGEAVFTQVGESLLPGVYEAAGLVAGEHLYEVVGRNSRGDGPASAPLAIDVQAVAVA